MACRNITFFAVVILLAIVFPLQARLKPGTYRGVLRLKPGVELPFNFEVKYEKRKPFIIIRNAEERITVDEIRITRDSVNFKMPGFDTEFRTARKGDNLEGEWINHYRTTANRIRFTAEYGNDKRFITGSGDTVPLFNGKWSVVFSPGKQDSTRAIGRFMHHEQTELITGTFLTETGDYRFLEGVQDGNSIRLSCFNGSWAFLFTAILDGDGLQGTFYSGAHWQEPWRARRDEAAVLRDAESITFVKDKNAALTFTFTDTDGRQISLSDERYRGKPVIVQLMGSWCPNCMDESRYLKELFAQYNPRGLEMIGVAFEKTTDVAKAAMQARRMKERLGIPYPVLVTGETGKSAAAAAFPQLNAVTAFPTTLFLDRSHTIAAVHTGFSGPATGSGYTKLQAHYESIIHTIISR
jgi:peroxiredoxin